MSAVVADRIASLVRDTAYYPPDPYETAHRRRRLAFQIVLLCILAIAPFWPSFGNAAIWQDNERVTNNLALRTTAGIARLWLHPRSEPAFRPLASTMLAAERHLWSANLENYHLVSMLLHAINVALLWKVLRRLNVAGAWLAAAVFAVHPMAVSSVAWVSGQDVLLGAALALGAMLAYLRWRGVEPELAEDHIWIEPAGRHGAWYATAVVLLVAAILSQPAAAVVPFAILILVRWQGKRGWREVAALVPLIAIAAVGGALAIWVGSGEPTLSPSRALLATTQATVRGLVHLAAPWTSRFVYDAWDARRPATWLCFAGLAILLTFVLVPVVRRRVGRGVGCAVVLFLIATIAAMWLGGREWLAFAYGSDAFHYIAAAAPIALLAAGLTRACDRFVSPDRAAVARAACGIAIIGGLSVLTWGRSALYADEMTLWRGELARGATSPVVRERLGALLLARGKPTEALEQFRVAHDRDPESITTTVGLCRALQAAGQLDAAKDEYVVALKAAPGDVRLWMGLANVLAQQGRASEAEDAYGHVLELKPADESAHNDLGLLLASEGRPGLAIWHYRAALRARPNSVPVRLNLANALFRQGDFAAAAETLQEVVKIDPSNFEAFMNAGAMLGELREFEKAEQMFRAALRLKADSAEAHDNLGLALAHQGKLNDAVFHFGKAVELKPEASALRQHLEMARKQAAAPATQNVSNGPVVK